MTATPTEHRAKIAEARNVLGEVISRARYANEPTVLINRGKEAAVIVSYEDYMTLRELRGYLRELEAGTTSDDAHKARMLGEAMAVAQRRALGD
ncbi:type II toxin-antitoxin system Phd/YefM family antitoxin [Streptomyces rubrogriseus]|uniref:type II toxin-antitoxin system Phd/YefM family antitoxin n=1 Tax=Streptomyces rubrogriseus TaxID=194673 RepID=UPI000D59C76E|nr:type II toxin-antitoxin system prevent-host-death family antitoxin [Streptomyces rubrogriseus]